MADEKKISTILCIITAVLFIVHTVGYLIGSIVWCYYTVEYFAPAGGKCSLLTATACFCAIFAAGCLILGVTCYLLYRFSRNIKILNFIFIGIEALCLLVNIVGVAQTRHWNSGIEIMGSLFARDAMLEWSAYLTEDPVFAEKVSKFFIEKYGSSSILDILRSFVQDILPYSMNIAFLVMHD
ncbi:hypothetical protein GPJ56_002374 [Histomonas meleagridis]|uniref:uncharacterized protein n=1 Tax=Histomonas meleagridis TaxID=135588 RepID=UPI003559C184|nr:hypothetical protein GPJ56_002374 [Histomonas meleagridis]KAH0801894.1 hypothetical protein GO595_005312 [Histomonas meleagridis]